MNPFDQAILSFLNQHAQEWPLFDRAVCTLGFNDLLKGAIPVAILWGLWFSSGEEKATRERRALILATVAATLVALAMNRTLASLLPFRERPLQAPGLEFVPPVGMRSQAFSSLSAFPSDHAVMFLGLSTGVFLVSRSAGIFLLLHALVLVLLPRLYLGLHYPTDILAGAVLGVGMVWLATRTPVRARLARPLLRWSAAHPPSFYALFALLAFLLATLFDPAVKLARFLSQALFG